MPLLKIYLALMLATLIPVLVNFWFMFSDKGNKVFWMLLVIAFLGFVSSPFLISSGYLDGTISVVFQVIMYYVVWVFLTLIGLVVWLIFFLFVDGALWVLGSILGFRFSLFWFCADLMEKLLLKYGKHL